VGWSGKLKRKLDDALDNVFSDSGSPPNIRLGYESPDDPQPLVETELFITGHHRDILGQCLGDHLAVEGIGMAKRQIE
jgi:hypothetical protein